MYIVVHHHVADPVRFMQIAAGEGSLPPGVTMHSFLPTRDPGTVFCLWEAMAVAAVRDLLDSAFGDTSRNEYFEVEPAHAFGFPVTTGATAGAAS